MGWGDNTRPREGRKETQHWCGEGGALDAPRAPGKRFVSLQWSCKPRKPVPSSRPCERLGRSRGHGKHLEAQLSPPGGQEQHRGPLPQLTDPPVPHPRKSGSQASGPRMHAGKGTHAWAHTHTHALEHPLVPALTFCMPHSVPSRRGTRRRLQLLWSRGSVWQDRAWHMS